MDKRKLEILKRLQALDNNTINEVINDGKEETNHEIRRKFARYEKNGWLRFDKERVHTLAEGFKNPQQMVDYEGDNQEQIRSAGQLIMGHKIERPEWFDDLIEHKTPEQVLEKVQPYTKWEDIPYSLQQKLWRHFDKKQLRDLLPNIEWGRVYWTDDMIYQQLSKYKDVKACRNSPDKFILTKLQIDKGENFPESYALYRSKLVGHSGPRSKRGNYKQRTPSIVQCDLNKVVINVYETWKEVEEAGFKRSSVACAIRGTDGHNKHKGFLWKYFNQDFTK